MMLILIIAVFTLGFAVGWALAADRDERPYPWIPPPHSDGAD